MELRLSLGVVSSSSKPFVDETQISTAQVPHLSSFYTGLSLPSKSTDEQVEDEDVQKHSSRGTIQGKNPSLFGSDSGKYGEYVGIFKRSLDDHGGNALVEGERGSSNVKASDHEDENGTTRKKHRLSKQQSAFLEESFMKHSSTLNPVSNIKITYLLHIYAKLLLSLQAEHVWTCL